MVEQKASGNGLERWGQGRSSSRWGETSGPLTPRAKVAEVITHKVLVSEPGLHDPDAYRGRHHNVTQEGIRVIGRNGVNHEKRGTELRLHVRTRG